MKSVCYRGDRIPEAAVNALCEDSFLASPGFASVWSELGGRRVVWAVCDEERILGVLPGIEFGFRPIRRFMAMPNGLYGRLFVDTAAGSRTQSIGEEMVRGVFDEGYIKTYVFDFYPGSLPHRGAFAVKPEQAILVDISDAAWEPEDRKLRGEIRRAEREGLAVARMDWLRDRPDFLRLVRNMQTEHGGEERYPERFWRKLAEVAATDDRVRWYFARFEGQAVSSHIYFIEGDLLIGWQMYYDRSFSPLKANPFLIYRACYEARPMGVRTLDLGATPKGADGTEFFKRRWGGYDHTYYELSARRGLGRLR